MRIGIVIMVILGIAGTAIAQDLGTSREPPVKNTPIVIYEPPAVPRQGGDTIADATVIPGLPYSNTGTTVGYLDDYDEACPYTGSTSPDVVYSYTSEFTGGINIDLCESSYDTKVYVYDDSMNLVECNDDFYFGDPCWTYSSRIENAPVIAGQTYFIVIDGYGGDAGEYVLLVEEFEPCIVYCHDYAVPEGEPPLHDGYEDAYNSGCHGSDYGYPFQPIDWTNDADGIPPYDGTAWLCGKSGWYIGESGGNYRDTDWFTITALETGMTEFTVESEYPCYLVAIPPGFCNLPVVFPQALADCGAPGTLVIPMTAGQETWLLVLPTTFTGPVPEFTYFMTVSNNTFDTVPAEGMSWGGVKSLYR